jgi:hypothetical protein
VFTAATGSGPIPQERGEDSMNTITSDPGHSGEPPWPRPTYPLYLLVYDVTRILAADGCEKISVTTENSGRAVEAGSDLLLALGVTPDREEP